jgi:hypothetical protein
MTKTALDPNVIDYVIGGTVIQEVRTSNIAREAAMAAGTTHRSIYHESMYMYLYLYLYLHLHLYIYYLYLDLCYRDMSAIR